VGRRAIWVARRWRAVATVADRTRAPQRRTSQTAKRAAPRRRPPSRSPTEVARRHRRVLVRLLLGGMVIVALLFAFVFPARTLLAQRQQTEKERARLEVLREQTRKLEAETRRLQNDAEIERIAREQYNFMRPGERPYVVVPPPTTAPPAPSTTTPAPPSSKP
jgi:cell division protein FtsB